MKSFKEYLQEKMDKSPLDVKTHNVDEIAKKHKVSVDLIKKQLIMGVKVEREHTKDDETAKEIALDHLWEVPNYYTKLKKVEE